MVLFLKREGEIEMKKYLMGMTVTILNFLALANVAPATTLAYHQPEVPKSLNK